MKYKRRNLEELEPYYAEHVSAMTGEGLHIKSDIAAELAFRDQGILALEKDNRRMKKIISEEEYSKGEENTKFDIVIHNLNEKGEKISIYNAGYRRSIKEVCGVVKDTLENPDSYRRVFIDGEPVMYPVLIEITEILNAAKFEPHSLHLDKDHK